MFSLKAISRSNAAKQHDCVGADMPKVAWELDGQPLLALKILGFS